MARLTVNRPGRARVTTPRPGAGTLWVQLFRPRGDQPGPDYRDPPPGYVARYDAHTLGLANGAAVTTWPDTSGNGHTLTRSAGTATYATGPLGINGRPAVVSNPGDTRFATATGFALPQPLTVFYVARLDDLAAGSGSYAMAIGGGGQTFGIFPTRAGGQWTILAGGTANLTTIPPAANGHTYAVAASINTTSTYARVNDVAAGPVSVGAAGTGFTAGFTVMTQTTQYWSGAIGEVIVYPAALTADELARLWAYAQTAWNWGYTPPPQPIPRLVAFTPEANSPLTATLTAATAVGETLLIAAKSAGGVVHAGMTDSLGRAASLLGRVTGTGANSALWRLDQPSQALAAGATITTTGATGGSTRLLVMAVPNLGPLDNLAASAVQLNPAPPIIVPAVVATRPGLALSILNSNTNQTLAAPAGWTNLHNPATATSLGAAYQLVPAGTVAAQAWDTPTAPGNASGLAATFGAAT